VILLFSLCCGLSPCVPPVQFLLWFSQCVTLVQSLLWFGQCVTPVQFLLWFQWDDEGKAGRDTMSVGLDGLEIDRYRTVHTL
jgi:hypothetical protein